MNIWPRILIALTLLPVLGSGMLQVPDDDLFKSDPPDILVILVDDLGWHDVGFTGGDLDLSPNVDRFARTATIFPNAYSDGPNCAPTRASLLTGLSTPRHGIITVNSSRRGKAENRRVEPVANRQSLEPSTPTLPGRLKASGWRTAHIGKFHVGPDPLAYGFTDAVAGNSRGHPKSYLSPYDNQQLPDGPVGEYLTDRLVSEAVEILEDEDDRPLFMYFSFYTVHTPIQPRSDLLELMRERHPERSRTAQKYGAMIMAMDEAVGRLLEAVDRRDRPCLVVFASDNGGLGRIGDNGPLRGSKGMLYEGGIRVPLAVRWHEPGGPSSSPHQVLLRDLAPTLLEIAGVGPGDQPMDGRSFASVRDGNHPSSRPLHWHFPAYLEGGGAAGPWRTTPVGAVRVGPWKLIEFFEDGHVELYNVDSDPGESRDLSKVHEDHVERLGAEMRRWRAEVGARLPEPLPAAELVQPSDTVKDAE